MKFNQDTILGIVAILLLIISITLLFFQNELADIVWATKRWFENTSSY